ncbi:MAG: hypothetical protein MZV63_39385 [Marinilabiliales bacterium]|nr:hypothetical protein [Marinilabiliales bacterium]
MLRRAIFCGRSAVRPLCSLWHHQHFIESDGDETVMTDIVTYLPPFGIFGRIANLFFIRRRLKEIFDYREEALKRWSNSLKTEPLLSGWRL